MSKLRTITIFVSYLFEKSGGTIYMLKTGQKILTLFVVQCLSEYNCTHKFGFDVSSQGTTDKVVNMCSIYRKKKNSLHFMFFSIVLNPISSTWLRTVYSSTTFYPHRLIKSFIDINHDQYNLSTCASIQRTAHRIVVISFLLDHHNAFRRQIGLKLNGNIFIWESYCSLHFTIVTQTTSAFWYGLFSCMVSDIGGNDTAICNESTKTIQSCRVTVIVNKIWSYNIRPFKHVGFTHSN